MALFPISPWRNYNAEHPAFLHIKEPIYTREIGLSYVREHYMSQSAGQFKDYIIEYFDNVIRDNTQSQVSHHM